MVLSKEEIEQKRKEIGIILKNNDMHYDCSVDPEGMIEIDINMGDWKHEHRRLINLMSHMGYVFFGREEYGEDTGDDSFSARYRYF